MALAKQLDVPLSPNNFVETSCFAPTTTFQEGIYSCGAFNGPKDIPQSVMEGSAAAAASTRLLAAARGTWPEKGLPRRWTWRKRPRVGFLCATAA